FARPYLWVYVLLYEDHRRAARRAAHQGEEARGGTAPPPTNAGGGRAPHAARDAWARRARGAREAAPLGDGERGVAARRRRRQPRQDARMASSAVVIAIDSNLLIYAHPAAVPEHRRARRAIEKACGDPRGWGISLPSVS